MSSTSPAWVRRRTPSILLVLGASIIAWLWWRQRDPSNADADQHEVGREQASSPSPVQAADAASFPPWRGAHASIAGFVRDDAGRAVAGAQVCATLSGQRAPLDVTREPVCTHTGTDGRYLLEQLPSVHAEVFACAPGFAPGLHRPAAPPHEFIALRPGDARRDVDIMLRRGGVEVRGIVNDLLGGVVEGARVMAGRRGRARAITISDEAGAFSLWVERGEVTLWASAQGYVDAGEQGIAPSLHFEVVLTPESVLSGRVVRADDGTPIAGARVSYRADDPDGVDTDDDGRFRLDRLPPGRYKPAARFEGGFGLAANSVELGLGEHRDGIEIRVHPMARVRGKIVIVGAQRRACPKGWLELRGANTAESQWAYGDDDGAVDQGELRPGRYTVVIACEGALARDHYDDIVVDAAGSDGHVWEVEEGDVLSGLVVDDDDAPIADAYVYARGEGGDGRVAVDEAGARSDERGRFTLTGLRPGNHHVGAQHDEYLSPATTTAVDVVSAGGSAAAVTLRLSRGGSVRGHVHDEHDRPVARASVTVDDSRWRTSSVTGEDGGFVISHVRPGDYRVFAGEGWGPPMRAPGTGDDDLQGTRVHVERDGVVEVELKVESQSGRIGGTVVDADGGPVADTFVSAVLAGNGTNASAAFDLWRARASSTNRVLTDADGAFVLESLGSGRCTVVAMRPGGGEGIVEQVEVGRTDVIITVGDGISMAGTLVGADGRAPERFTITVSDAARSLRREEPFFETGGAWTLDGLAAGHYTLAAAAYEGVTQTDVALVDGADVTGLRLQLEARVEVRGTVVDLDTGAPVPGMVVDIWQRKGEFRGFDVGGAADREDVTDVEGRFRLSRMPSGAVSIYVLPRDQTGGSRYDGFSMPARISGDAPTVLLPPLRIPARKLGANERAGDLGFTIAAQNPADDEEDWTFRVARVHPNGPAAATALAVGDIIVAVDGHDVQGANAYLYYELARVPEGASLRLDLLGGRSVTVVATEPR